MLTCWKIQQDKGRFKQGKRRAAYPLSEKNFYN